jgi:hypothetical protein
MAKAKGVLSKTEAAIALVKADDEEKRAKKIREKARAKVLEVFGVEKVEVEVDEEERSVEVAESEGFDKDSPAWEELCDHLRESGKKKLVRSEEIDVKKLHALCETDKEVRVLANAAKKPSFRVTVK